MNLKSPNKELDVNEALDGGKADEWGEGMKWSRDDWSPLDMGMSKENGELIGMCDRSREARILVSTVIDPSVKGR